MKVKTGVAALFAIVAVSIFIGCSSEPKAPSAPKAPKAPSASGGAAYTPVRSGSPTKLDEISPTTVDDPVTGKKLTFEFLGETWIQQVDGKPLLAGTLKLDGNVATLTQTHMYSEQVNPLTKKPLGWQAVGGQVILLDYVEGPPVSVAIKK